MRVLLIVFFAWTTGGGGVPTTSPPPCQLPPGWSWPDNQYVWVVTNDGEYLRWTGTEKHKWLFAK